MAKKKSKPLTDEEFLEKALPGLDKKNGHWYFYVMMEAGHGNEFENMAKRLVNMCIARGGSGKVLESHGWWKRYKHKTFAMHDRYRNYCILDMDGAFARHLEALITRRGAYNKGDCYEWDWGI